MLGNPLAVKLLNYLIKTPPYMVKAGYHINWSPAGLSWWGEGPLLRLRPGGRHRVLSTLWAQGGGSRPGLVPSQVRRVTLWGESG